MPKLPEDQVKKSTTVRMTVGERKLTNELAIAMTAKTRMVTNETDALRIAVRAGLRIECEKIGISAKTIDELLGVAPVTRAKKRSTVNAS